MVIAAALLMIVFGVSQIALKDIWWWDIQLLSQYYGVGVSRSAAWERQRNLWGAVWLMVGLVALLYALAG